MGYYTFISSHPSAVFIDWYLMDWQRCQTHKTLISAGALLNSGPMHVTKLYFCFRGSVTFTKCSIEETNINLIYSTSVGIWQQYPFIYLFDLLEKYSAFPSRGQQVFVTLPIHIWFPDEWVGWLSGWGLFGGFHSVVKPRWKSEEQAGEGVHFCALLLFLRLDTLFWVLIFFQA